MLDNVDNNTHSFILLEKNKNLNLKWTIDYFF